MTIFLIVLLFMLLLAVTARAVMTHNRKLEAARVDAKRIPRVGSKIRPR